MGIGFWVRASPILSAAAVLLYGWILVMSTGGTSVVSMVFTVSTFPVLLWTMHHDCCVDERRGKS